MASDKRPWHSPKKSIDEIGEEHRKTLLEGLPGHSDPETIFHHRRLSRALECFGLDLRPPTIDYGLPPEHTHEHWTILDRLNRTVTPWHSVESLIERIRHREYGLTRNYQGDIIKLG